MVMHTPETFEEWEAQAVTKQPTLHFGRGGFNDRDIYDMLGQCVFVETIFPWSCFDGIGLYTKAVDFNIREHSDIMDIARKHGAKWERGYYARDGYGWPVWKGEDGTRHCFEFIQEWRTTRNGEGIHSDAQQIA